MQLNASTIAYFHTGDLSRAWRVAGALEYGMIRVNQRIISSEMIGGLEG
jgi:acyl-CoA reductase-like NAD-dependent aldehyde dehydrogenase